MLKKILFLILLSINLWSHDPELNDRYINLVTESKNEIINAIENNYSLYAYYVLMKEIIKD